jgi:hypothetical protein
MVSGLNLLPRMRVAVRTARAGPVFKKWFGAWKNRGPKATVTLPAVLANQPVDFNVADPIQVQDGPSQQRELHIHHARSAFDLLSDSRLRATVVRQLDRGDPFQHAITLGKGPQPVSHHSYPWATILLGSNRRSRL